VAVAARLWRCGDTALRLSVEALGFRVSVVYQYCYTPPRVPQNSSPSPSPAHRRQHPSQILGLPAIAARRRTTPLRAGKAKVARMAGKPRQDVCEKHRVAISFNKQGFATCATSCHPGPRPTFLPSFPPGTPGRDQGFRAPLTQDTPGCRGGKSQRRCCRRRPPRRPSRRALGSSRKLGME
jgi:hypothetical protein